LKLRDYQQEAYDLTLKALDENKSTLCVLATGLGKTVYAAHIIDYYRLTGRIMMVAHREELINQGAEKIEIVTGEKSDIEMGDQWATSNNFFASEIVVSTIQTQIAGRDGGRMTRFDPNEFSLLVIDEAHHAPADTYRRIVKYYQQNPNLKVLGLTATPDRHDKKAMGQIFDTVAYEYGIKDGINDGWLVPITQQSVIVDGLDYSQVKTTAGDLNGKDLATILEFEENLHAIADPTVQLTGDKKSLIFAASVAQAERLTEIINRHKPDSAQFVCGTTPKEIRRQMFSDFAVKRFQYLVNVGVATEGFDDPSIECVVLARPTKSRSLFTQMVGRGTRPLTGLVDGLEDAIARREAIDVSAKQSLEVLDFVGNAGRHKLISTADILGGEYDEEVVELARKNAEEESDSTKKPVDIASELVKAEREISHRRAMEEDAVSRNHILARAKFSTAKVNPFNVLDITPKRETPWHKGKPPTTKQQAYLKNKGVDTDGMGFTHAAQAITEIISRQKAGKCTYKQAKQLYRRGIDTTKITFEDAGKMMGELANNHWQTPPRWRGLDCWIK